MKSKRKGELSVLERADYSKLYDEKLRYTNRSVMEIAVYNPTVPRKKGTWEKVKEKIKKILRKGK